MIVKGIEAAQKDLAIEKERALQEEVLNICSIFTKLLSVIVSECAKEYSSSRVTVWMVCIQSHQWQ